MAFQGFSNDQAPEAFGAMVRRQGAGGNAMTRPGGVTPPGPNSSPQWFNPPQEFSKGGDRSQKAYDANDPYRQQGPMDPKTPLGVSELGPQGPFTPMGQMGPKGGPMGPGGYGRPQMGMQPEPAPRGGEGGNPWIEDERGQSGPFTPQGQMEPKYPMGMGGNMPDPRFPMHQRLPQMTRQQWQQNRTGQLPQMPMENPAQPSEDWLGRSNGAPMGWNWSR